MNKVTLYILIFIFSVFVSSISQILLKKSAIKNYSSKAKEYLNPMVIVAYTLFLLSTFVTIIAYRIIPLSLGPVLESFGFIFVSILGVKFLDEKMGKKKILGIMVIVIGVIICSI